MTKIVTLMILTVYFSLLKTSEDTFVETDVETEKIIHTTNYQILMNPLFHLNWHEKHLTNDSTSGSNENCPCFNLRRTIYEIFVNGVPLEYLMVAHKILDPHPLTNENHLPDDRYRIISICFLNADPTNLPNPRNIPLQQFFDSSDLYITLTAPIILEIPIMSYKHKLSFNFRKNRYCFQTLKK